MSNEITNSQIDVEISPPANRRSTKVVVTVKQSGTLIYTDNVDLRDAQARKKFAKCVRNILHQRGIERTVDEIENVLMQSLEDANHQSSCQERAAILQIEDARAIIAELGLQVLGDNDAGEVEIYNKAKHKRYRIANLNRVTEVNLLQFVGSIPAGTNDGESALPDLVGRFKAAVALIAGNMPRLSSRDTAGQGVFAAEAGKILVVNGAEAQLYDGANLTPIDGAIHGNTYLDFGEGVQWAKKLPQKLAAMNAASAAAVLTQVETHLRQWNWLHPADAQVAAAMVFATLVQSMWSWRPVVNVIGESGCGKSTLFADFLKKVFGRWTVLSDRSTEAGIRQHVKNDSAPIALDEFDSYAHRRQIIEMLRSAGRGNDMLRGTRDQQGASYRIRHIFWLAAIDVGDGWTQDTNRRIQLSLGRLRNCGYAPLSEAALQELHEDVVAAAIWVATAAVRLADDATVLQVDGVHHRIVESFTCAASMYTVLQSGREATAEQVADNLRTFLTGRENLIAQSSTEQQEILQAILTTLIGESTGQGYRQRTVAELLSTAARFRHGQDSVENVRVILANHGLAVIEPRGELQPCLFIDPKTVQRGLLSSTRWAGMQLGEVLLRLSGAERSQQRMGGLSRRSGVLLPWPEDIEVHIPEPRSQQA